LFSDNATTVARGGYEQALAYLAEARTGLIESGEAIVVGPAEIVDALGTAETTVGRVHIACPRHVPDVLARFVAP